MPIKRQFKKRKNLILQPDLSQELFKLVWIDGLCAAVEPCWLIFVVADKFRDCMKTYIGNHHIKTKHSIKVSDNKPKGTIKYKFPPNFKNKFQPFIDWIFYIKTFFPNTKHPVPLLKKILQDLSLRSYFPVGLFQQLLNVFSMMFLYS